MFESNELQMIHKVDPQGSFSVKH